VDAYLYLREDLERVGYAAYAVELLDRFTYEEGENPAMYRLLADTLARLDTESDPELPIHYYEIRLLDLLGFRPQLFTCTSCGKEIQPQDQYFSASLGGVLCPSLWSCYRRGSPNLYGSTEIPAAFPTQRVSRCSPRPPRPGCRA
jgi:DNA repair protein RecO (recombination protein O)